ncbi:hypothetical protein OCT63_09615 [Vibrio sp. RW]|uniref:hypothetical protein n=1 Tax=Vibrio sp. RW TaxID=2998833 RepID=UPI0022CD4768|nr:hypothetical protein [Vibrio sp. RW]MDA0144486.1 hypothetical protein [Vibrio sp. RW]
MVKKIVLGSAVLLFGCASNSGYDRNMSHGEQFDLELETPRVKSFIQAGLKDPDSLKNLVVVPEKCFLTDYFVQYVDNSASWCVTATYQAKNSYGGYVRGTEFLYREKDTGYYIPSFRDNFGIIQTSKGNIERVNDL